jgi:hypothetical protein
MFGGITARESSTIFTFESNTNGNKTLAPRANVGRDSGLLYLSIGPPGAGSGAWMIGRVQYHERAPASSGVWLVRSSMSKANG